MICMRWKRRTSERVAAVPVGLQAAAVEEAIQLLLLVGLLLCINSTCVYFFEGVHFLIYTVL